MEANMSQVQNPSAAHSGSQLLNKNQHSPIHQSLSILPTANPLPSEHAGRPHHNSALPPSSVTSGSAAAVSSNMANPKEKTPMCLVNELARYNKVQPQYKLLSEQGPAHSKVIPLGRWQDYSLLERVGEDRPKQMFTVQLTLGDQYWEAEGTSIKKAQHAAAAKALEGTKYPKPAARPSRDSITPTVELNALCMKLGRKPTYKPLDPYTGIRSSYNYNMPRGGGYPPRYFYPFPVTPILYQVELSIGGQQFHGKGRTRQAAKHDAAAKALKSLQHEPLPSKPEINGKSDEENLNKSEISQVFEIALKRNLPVNFEVTKETGPPHMKSFITKVLVGEFIGEGEGKSKKVSKKNAAIAILEELKKLPPLPIVEKLRPRIKKKTKSIVKLPTSPDYGQGMNPISRLAQIQQAKKDKEPEYFLVTERGLPRRREFVMQVKVGNLTAEGLGANKKVAKRNAAENMLELLGFKIPPAPPKPALKTDEKMPVKKPGDGRKVTFYEPGSGEDTANNKDDEFRMPYHSHQQLPAGILPMVPEVAQAVGANQGLHAKEFNRVAPNPAIATVTAMIARELLYGGTSPTADTILKNNNNTSANVLHGPLTRPSEQLQYLSIVQAIEVEYKDFPKNNKNEFVSLINCSFQPPLISHGVGKDVESCHDMAAMNILKLLSEMDQQNAEVPRPVNGPMSVCGKPEMESDPLLKAATSNPLGQAVNSTA
ncbi:double-stranded RNA-binding protein Staufen homolog 1 isoform X2 [Phyllobates terribilis]|uniref:double-stranded RNA-binding protein Staufen homolog 1 isoform X2 n=1 Tax=Phyllobates terribilis TaxID=111132 RepID=UPI003CCA912C